MTYRARVQGRSARRRAWKAAQFESAVQKKVAHIPPRTECIYVPARPPSVEEPTTPYTGEPVVVYELGGPKPLHRVFEVPIVPTGPELRQVQKFMQTYPRDAHPRLRTMQFQAQEFRLDVDNTRVRWWSWQPVNDALKPETRSILHRAWAHSERVKHVLREVLGIVADGRELNPY